MKKKAAEFIPVVFSSTPMCPNCGYAFVKIETDQRRMALLYRHPVPDGDGCPYQDRIVKMPVYMLEEV